MKQSMLSKRDLQIALCAARIAADFELNAMDAHRNPYLEKWRPMKGSAEGYRIAERGRKRYLRLAARIEHILAESNRRNP